MSRVFTTKTVVVTIAITTLMKRGVWRNQLLLHLAPVLIGWILVLKIMSRFLALIFVMTKGIALMVVVDGTALTMQSIKCELVRQDVMGLKQDVFGLRLAFILKVLQEFEMTLNMGHSGGT